MINPKKQWMALNRVANTYKIICYSQIGLFLVLLVAFIYTSALPPLVVHKTTNGSEYFKPVREPTKIEPQDIEQFVKQFIKINYEWTEFNSDEMLKNIHPFITTDFYRLIKKRSKTLKKPEGEFSQYTGNIKVSVTEKDVVAQFDKIIRLKGVPLVTVTQVSFQIIKNAANVWNPIGLYVNGLIEHQVK